MKRVLKINFGKRVRGLSQYLATLVAIATLVTFFVAMVYQYGAILKENDIHRIHRKYLLSMEREGYLTPSYETALRNELAAYGAYNVNLSGTSISPVGYGNIVVLRIECDVTIDQLTMSTLFGSNTGGVRHVIVEKDSTALY